MIFVSYSWEKEKPDENVMKLVDGLRKLGYEARMDVMDIQSNSTINFAQMMATNLKVAEKVIVILSEKYKEKADSFSGGVGEEYKYILNDMKTSKNKYIFASFSKSDEIIYEKILPDFLKGQSIVSVDLQNLKASSLIYKIAEKEEILFSEVNPDIYVPETKSLDDNVENKKEEEYVSSGFDVCTNSTSLFDYRIRSAFPGVRGIKIFENPVECISRLKILLRQPLVGSSMRDPIWYFRGNSCLDISFFTELSENKILLGNDEYIIDKIAVYINPNSYYRDFIYIQTKADSPCGAYTYSDGTLHKYEEFGLFNDTVITREEYDDGAAVINGKVVQSNGRFCLRTRRLVPYNFVICAKFHPFNSDEGDRITREYCNGILNGTYTIEDFVNASQTICRHPYDR